MCVALRRHGVAIPIIAMTGNVDPSSVALFKRAGFSGLLAKPFGDVRALLCDLLDAPTALAACCGFDLCHKYILYLYLYLRVACADCTGDL